MDSKAEETQLPDQSVDIIFSAQAFHWFQHGPTKTEWKRILKPNGIVFLIWNSRLWLEYEDLLQELCPGIIIVLSKITHSPIFFFIFSNSHKRISKVQPQIRYNTTAATHFFWLQSI